MDKSAGYLEFIKSRGFSLSEINPGSDEIALSVNDTLEAIEILNKNQIPVLGGDVLSKDDLGILGYAMDIWGDEYHYLNWYCDKFENESYSDYCIRSYKIAREYIRKALEISKRLNKECHVVLVVLETNSSIS